MAKLNSIEGIKRLGINGGENYSIRTRQIDNGWVTSETRHNSGTGRYQETETYSEKRPRITPPDVDTKGGVNSTRERTLDYWRK